MKSSGRVALRRASPALARVAIAGPLNFISGRAHLRTHRKPLYNGKWQYDNTESLIKFAE